MGGKAKWMDAPKKIFVTTTGIMITPYKSNLNPRFEALHSVPNYGRRWRTPFTGYYHKEEHFYSCAMMNPRKVQVDYFPDYEIEYANPVRGLGTYPFEFKSDEYSLRDQQQAFVEEATSYELRGCRRIFNNLQTGLGKTAATIYMIAQHQKKAAIISHMKNILSQWETAFEKFTTIPPDRILICDKSEILIKAIVDPYPIRNYDIFIMSHALIESLARRIGWVGVSQVFGALGVGIKVYDEAHRNLESMITLDSVTSVEYTYYLTADFNQSTKAKGSKYQRVFDGVPILPEEQEMRTLKYVNVLTMTYNSHPTMLEQQSVMTRQGFSRFHYMRYQYRKPYVLHCIEAVIHHFYTDPQYADNQSRVLVLTSLIEHVDYLFAEIQSRFPDKVVGIYHGDVDKATKDESKKNADIIVASYSSFSYGIDAPNIACVISCDPVDRLADNQAAGRARPQPGKQALYVMLYDMGFDRSVRSKATRTQYLQNSKASKFYTINVSEKDVIPNA